MDLGRIAEGITADLRRAGAIGGEETGRVAELLVAGVEPTVRLHLIEALHELAGELEAAAPGVAAAVRLDGGRVLIGLTLPAVEPAPAEGVGSAGEWGDDELLRLTVRLPESLKARVEQAAALAGASINSWIVSALARALEAPAGTGPHPGRRMPRRITGFVQG